MKQTRSSVLSIYGGVGHADYRCDIKNILGPVGVTGSEEDHVLRREIGPVKDLPLSAPPLSEMRITRADHSCRLVSSLRKR